MAVPAGVLLPGGEVSDGGAEYLRPFAGIAEQYVAVAAEQPPATPPTRLSARATRTVVVDGEVRLPSPAWFGSLADGADPVLCGQQGSVFDQRLAELGAKMSVPPLVRSESGIAFLSSS